MKIKVSEATELQLDWLVAKCEGIDFTEGGIFNERNNFIARRSVAGKANWSTEWAQGGPIIVREEFCAPTRYYGCAEGNPNKWQAGFGVYPWMRGHTPLIAAMRCYIASKLGDEVEVPDDLELGRC